MKLFVIAILMSSSMASNGPTGYAADLQPIEKKIEAAEQKIDDASIMGRVQLVGVIADHSASDAGIALIKDAHTGRTYAIKTGDNLPGVAHIVLNKVRRELAVFRADNKDYQVRLSFVTDTNGSNSNSQDSNVSGEPNNVAKEGPGLFEEWAAGVPQKSTGAITSDILNKIHPRIDPESKTNENVPLTTKRDSELNESQSDIENNVIED